MLRDVSAFLELLAVECGRDSLIDRLCVLLFPASRKIPQVGVPLVEFVVDLLRRERAIPCVNHRVRPLALLIERRTDICDREGWNTLVVERVHFRFNVGRKIVHNRLLCGLVLDLVELLVEQQVVVTLDPSVHMAFQFGLLLLVWLLRCA